MHHSPDISSVWQAQASIRHGTSVKNSETV